MTCIARLAAALKRISEKRKKERNTLATAEAEDFWKKYKDFLDTHKELGISPTHTLHSQKYRLVAESSSFTNAVTVVILIAGIMVGVSTYDTSGNPDLEFSLALAEEIIVGIFVAEVVVMPCIRIYTRYFHQQITTKWQLSLMSELKAGSHL